MIDALGALLAPTDFRLTHTVRLAAPDWSDPPTGPPGSDLTIWGRGPRTSITDTDAPVAYAIARERAVLASRRASGQVRVHRLPPPTFPTTRVRRAARGVLLAGVVIERWRGTAHVRVIDEIVAAAADTPPRVLLPGRSGAIGAHVDVRGRPGFLRAAVRGSPGDPSRPAAALDRIGASVAAVPRVLARGTTSTASWTVESRLPGSIPTAVPAGAMREAAAVVAALPQADGPAAAFERDLREVTRALPSRREAIDEATARARATVAELPGVLRHGDLSLVNVLVDGHRLGGIIDWEHWEPDGVPGADLVHLAATSSRELWARPVGERWLERPWRSPAFDDLVAPVWRRLRIRPTADLLDALGVAWWAAETAFTVTRDTERRHDDAWLATHVDAVLDALRQDRTAR